MTSEDLLRIHRDGIYTVCLHVLRHPQDAEDAAQEAALKIAAEAGTVREPRAFKSWLYRVVYRTAVDHLRRRETRRRIEEGSASMPVPALTDAQREAIHEAMAALPDGDRLMLVEHYFEKVTIEELGRREGISDVAMGKRVEKAREKLKRGLAGAGILIAAAQVTHAFESVKTVAAPPSLFGAATLVAVGGTTVGSKSAAFGLVVFLVLILAVGGGYLAMRKRAPLTSRSSIPTQAPESKTPAESMAAPAGRVAAPPLEKGDERACRWILARGITGVRSGEVHLLAFHLAWGEDRTTPEIEACVREFISSAGADLIAISKTVLADVQSEAMRFLITVALGRSGNPAALDVLKELVGEGPGTVISAVALHSIGQLKTPAGLAFLRSEWNRVKEPLLPSVITAIGGHGAEGLAVLLTEAKSSRFDSEVNYQGIPWSFSLSRGDLLAYARGPDLFEGLKAILESEEDQGIRQGAACALAENLEPGQVDFLAELLAREQVLKERVIYSLTKSGATADRGIRTELANRILSETPYPSGHSGLDRAMLRLGKLASPEIADLVFERFLAHFRQTRNPELFWAVGDVISACAQRPGAKAKISAVMDSAQLSEEEKALVIWVSLESAPPEVAPALRAPVLEILRTSHPRDQRFQNSLQALIKSSTDDGTLSTALQEVYDRLPHADRPLLLRESSRRVDRSGNTSIPRTFFESTIRQSSDPESVIYAAYGMLASPAGLDADPAIRKRVLEWIDRDMKWAAPTPERSYLPSVATSVIGDYYSKFGRPEDVAWLKELPETFPYPAAWKDGRASVKRALVEESRRAIDAIRLRN